MDPPNPQPPSGQPQPERQWQQPDPPPQQGWGGGQPQWGSQPPPVQPQWGGQPQQPTQWGAPGAAPGRPVLRPGIIPLRPLSLGEILDGAIQALRRNPRGMIGSAAVVVLGSGLLTLAVVVPLVPLVSSWLSTSAENVSQGEVVSLVVGAVLVTLALSIVTMVAQTVLTGMLATGVGQAVMGRKSTIRQLWEAAKPLLWRIVGVSLVVGVAQVAAVMLPLIVGALFFVVGTGTGVAATLLGSIVAVAAFCFVYTRLALTVPALVLESSSMATALRRSWMLSGRLFWRLLGILILTAIIVGLIAGAIQVPFSIIAQLVGFAGDGTVSTGGDAFTAAAIVGSVVVSTMGSLVAGILTYPFSAAVLALLYLDTRMRLEGLDIALNEQVQREHQAKNPGQPGTAGGYAPG